MSNRYMFLAAVLATPGLVYAQKGTGAATGMAREQVKPATQALSGTVTSIVTGACEKTTGKAPLGTHVILLTTDKKTVNLHLGPAGAEVVKEVLAAVKEGSKVEAAAFQTAALPADQFIAKSVTVDGKTLQLRDDTLRPAWAGAMGGGGRGPGGGPGPCF